MKKYIILFFTLSVLVYCANDCGNVYGHENEDWRHMRESSGLLVGQSDCGDDVGIWWHDYDGDGVVDSCEPIQFRHHTVHRGHQFPPTKKWNEFYENWELKCRCEDLYNE